jgi:hypothetical protein
MRIPSKLVAAALVLFFAASPASVWAHERSDRARGTVERVTSTEVVVRAADGHEVAFVVTPETRFLRGERRVAVEDVREGERAVVEGRPAGDAVEARRVQLAPAPAR